MPFDLSRKTGSVNGSRVPGQIKFADPAAREAVNTDERDGWPSLLDSPVWIFDLPKKEKEKNQNMLKWKSSSPSRGTFRGDVVRRDARDDAAEG